MGAGVVTLVDDPRSTKAGGVLRLQPAGRAAPGWAIHAQRRPEGCSGYNQSRRAGLHHHLQQRSTKAGGVLRLQRGITYCPSTLTCSAQRRPEGCSGYNCSATPRRSRRMCPLNEGRRGAPATTGTDVGAVDAQTHRRSTKAGGVLRLQLATRCVAPSPPWALNEGRRGAPATTLDRRPRR